MGDKNIPNAYGNNKLKLHHTQSWGIMYEKQKSDKYNYNSPTQLVAAQYSLNIEKIAFPAYIQLTVVK